MLARLSALVLCACLVAVPAYAKDKPAAFSCTGVFGPDSSEALVKQTYGDKNVVTGQVPGAEGQDMLATTVFPNDPAKTIQFGWQDDDTRKGLAFVDLPPTIAGPFGVKVGMSVDEVAAINGKTFTIGGFWWDYGGYAQIDAGKLANADDAKCFLSLRFSPADDIPANINTDSISGDGTIIKSTDPLLKKVNTKLTSVEVSYAGPDAGADGSDAGDGTDEGDGTDAGE